VEKVMDRLELALARQQDTYLAGHLLLYGDKSVAYWRAGIKDGDPAHLKTGASAALHYNNILYLSGKGFKTMDLGHTRAYLRDGVLQHKKIWGMRLYDDVEHGSLLVAMNDLPQTKVFFENTPLIGVCNNTLTGMMFVRAADVQSQRKLKQTYQRHHLEGMERLRMLAIDDLSEYPAVPDELGDDLTIESTASFFPCSHN
jgi:hypothetical protein